MGTQQSNGAPNEKSAGTRAGQILVSISILTVISVVVGYGGGLLL